ncbi:MAG: hypothetical protein ACI81R_003872 [Bradymonadia bacterium]|jgi:hypothetical protein
MGAMLLKCSVSLRWRNSRVSLTKSQAIVFADLNQQTRAALTLRHLGALDALQHVNLVRRLGHARAYY